MRDRGSITLLVGVCVVVLALALAACGSGSGGSGTGGDARDAYAQELNRFCTMLQRGVGTLQTTVAKIPKNSAPEAALGTFATAIDRLAGTIDQGVRRLSASNPPASWKPFNDGAVKGLGSAVGRLHKVASDARGGDLQVLTDVGNRIGDLGVPKAPDDLRRKATACTV